MTHFSTAALALVAPLAIGASANAAVIASYDFTNESLASDVSPSNAAASDFSDGSGYSNTSFDGDDREVAGAGSGGNAATNSDNGEYFFFTVTADAGYELNLDGIELDAQRAGSSPDRITVFALPDGDDSLEATIVDNQRLNTTFTNYGGGANLQGAAFQSLDSIEIRVVFHGNNQGGGFNEVDNVVLTGESVLIPEPASLALLGLGGLCLLPRRRRNA